MQTLTTFTIDDIRAWNPCYDPARFLPEGWHGTALDVLAVEECRANDRLWVVLREECIDARTLRLFAVWCTRQALVLVGNPDPRSIAACDVAEKYTNGEATAAAWDAAWSAAWDAARDAAWDAAWDAARDAAWVAASAAARVAASAAARDAAGAAARAAARDAAWAAAWSAVSAAARDAARDAAGAAAWDAVWDAAWAAARDAQIDHLREMLT